MVFMVMLAGWILPVHAAKPAAKHVIIISIDGLRPELYLGLGRKAAWGSILSMQDNGAYAHRVDPPYPSLTYPGHATIVTGVWPARHQVTANTAFRPPDIEGRGLWYAGDVKAPTLWDWAAAAGKTVAAFSWPCTADTDKIKWNFPEFWSTPYRTEQQFLQKHATPELLQMVRDIGGPDWARRLKVAHERDELLTRMTVDLILRHRPNLVLLHLLELDKIQHRYGLATLRVGYAMRRASDLISEIREAVKTAGIDEQTAIIVLGDHGFANVTYTVAPNVPLVAAGLAPAKLTAKSEWKALVQNTGGSAAVHLRDPGDGESRQRAYDILQAHAVEASGRRLYRVIEEEELRALGGPAQASFYLEGEPGYMFSSALTGPLVRRSALNGNHGYLPTLPAMSTGFIAVGSGIRKRKIESMTLADVAPTVATLLGLDFPEVDGRVLTDILYR
jgi:predicted AlkP superfamily pyrophosphatase or phosphodiesterase